MPEPRADAPAPVMPDYRGACIANLLDALSAPADAAPEWLPQTARGAERLILLVLDGLGWEQLQTRTALAPTLAAADGAHRPITSVAPTTTATALTSLTTGRSPSEHGILG